MLKKVLNNCIPSLNPDMGVHELFHAVLKWLLLLIIIIGVPTVLISLIEAIHLQHLWAGIQYVIFLAVALLAAVFRARLGYTVSAMILITSIYYLAVLNVVLYGFSGAGIPLFFFMFIVATLFFGVRGGLIAVVSALAPLAAVGCMMVSGRLGPGVDLNMISGLPVSWLTAGSLVLMLGTIMVMGIGLLQKNLFEKIRIIKKQRDELERTNLILKHSLDENNALMNEVFHRTRNNMHVIISLLLTRAEQGQDLPVRSVCRDVVNKIRAMSLVHDSLYDGDDFSAVNLKTYISNYADMFCEHTGGSRSAAFSLDLQDVKVNLDTGVPFGLVLNELAANAGAHAFPGGRKGVISITCAEKNGMLHLQVADNGIGVPAGTDLRNTATLGLQHVFALVEYQLRGTISWRNHEGLRWDITIPLKKTGGA